MKTKAELEAEIIDLRMRVAALEAAVEAYQFAFQAVNPVTPQWPMTWPNYQPTWTWPNTTGILNCNIE